MARFIDTHLTRQSLTISEDRLRDLEAYLTREIEDALASRAPLEATWRELMRQYEGIPKSPMRDFPVENAPNVEVTLGAIAADSIYASIIDLITSANPLIMCRGIPKLANDRAYSDAVKALQRFTNFVAANEANFSAAADNSILDDVQLGTGCLYIPWVEETRKTRVANVISRSPRIYPIPIEDCIIPGGIKSTHPDSFPWIGLRFWLTEDELTDRARANKWDISKSQKAAAQDWVTTRRQTLARHTGGVQRAAALYEIIDIYCYYDIDNDGKREDLYIPFDRTARHCLAVNYNPYDRRPIELMVYQRRAHMPYGLGVLQMLQPYQDELTELHNYQTLNALLANCRIWKGREGRIPDNMRIWPGRVIPLLEPDADLKPETMADVYASLPAIQLTVMTLAERRVGANELAPSPRPQMFGSRMPGITAMSMLQQVNKRFTPAFNGAKDTLARAVIQCMTRYQERILAGDTRTVEHIYTVLGPEDGSRVVALLSEQGFDENVIIELTAATSSLNREADRQNAVMLTQLLGAYYDKTLQLVAIASNPQTPEVIRTVAVKIATAASEIIDRTIRTFDQVRDPSLFIVDVEDEIMATMQTQDQAALGQLLTLFAQGLGQGGQTPLLPPGMGG